MASEVFTKIRVPQNSGSRKSVDFMKIRIAAEVDFASLFTVFFVYRNLLYLLKMSLRPIFYREVRSSRFSSFRPENNGSGL